MELLVSKVCNGGRRCDLFRSNFWQRLRHSIPYNIKIDCRVRIVMEGAAQIMAKQPPMIISSSPAENGSLCCPDFTQHAGVPILPPEQLHQCQRPFGLAILMP
jgi:hypothetical protein